MKISHYVWERVVGKLIEHNTRVVQFYRYSHDLWVCHITDVPYLSWFLSVFTVQWNITFAWLTVRNVLFILGISPFDTIPFFIQQAICWSSRCGMLYYEIIIILISTFMICELYWNYLYVKLGFHTTIWCSQSSN